MAKFMFFASTPEMAKQAELLLEQKGKLDYEIRLAPIAGDAEVVQIARRSGAQIIIARGTIAEEIKRNTDLPVVEIVITAQEMGLLITQAKRIVNKPQPQIAVIGVPNMFCDMHDFNQIFEINLRTYFVESADALPEAVRSAVSDGAELIVGGEIVCANARHFDIPYLLQPSGIDSIRQAIRVASSVAFAADREKKIASEMNTLLDFSSNGIIKINPSGEVVVLNHLAEIMLGTPASEAVGQDICTLLPSLDARQIHAVLQGTEAGFFCTLMHSTGSALAIKVAPIGVENEIEGAILSCLEIQKLTEMEMEARRELNKNGVPRYDYAKMSTLFDENSQFLRFVRSHAKLNSHAFLCGSHAFERSILAHYMHSVRFAQTVPFVDISSAAYCGQAQQDNIFGSDTVKGAVLSANGGTLFIDDIERLSPQAQYRLFRLASENVLLRDGMEPLTVNLQLIVGAQEDLKTMLERGEFREDLYYYLVSYQLDIPDLKGNINEISNFVTYYIEMYCQRYARFIHVNRAALNMIACQPWTGGHAELMSFCRRLVVGATKRVIDETIAQQFLQSALPEMVISSPVESRQQVADAELARLTDLIEKYDGNRRLMADEMRISTTTLWRRLKKYNLM